MIFTFQSSIGESHRKEQSAGVTLDWDIREAENSFRDNKPEVKRNARYEQPTQQPTPLPLHYICKIQYV